MNWTATKSALSQSIGATIRRVPLGAPVLRAACRSRTLRRLGVQAIAIGYAQTLDEPDVRTATLDGYRVNVDLAEWSGATAYFFSSPGISWVTQHLVRYGDMCLDVGANAGLYANFLAHRTGAGGFTIAFEPNPAVAARLVASLRLNGFEKHTLVESRAAWERSGEALDLLVSDDPHNSGISSFVRQPHLATVKHKLRVETVTLDQVLQDHLRSSRCRFCKIDVERTELQVLRGFERTLQAHDVDYLLVELIAGAPADQYLVDRGYQGWLVSEQAPRLLPITEVAAGTFGDYVFVRSELVGTFRQTVVPIA
jgi:FkbM family methyltransferase